MKKTIMLLMLLVGLLLGGCDNNSNQNKTVTFETNGGTEVASKEVEYNKTISKPADPEKEGYTFNGWYLNDKEFDFLTPITENITLVAQWEEITDISYTVRFLDFDDTLLKEESVKEGGFATPPTSPFRDGYTFIGWDKEYDNITSDISIYAKYSYNEVVTSYTVRFLDFDDTLLKEEKVNEGEGATAPKDPFRDGYIFKGWDKEYSTITSDIVIKAIYEEISLDTEYEITYILNNGVWGYASKNAYVEAFLKDFYDFVNPGETLKVFLHGTQASSGFDGAWSTYIGGAVGSENHLLYNNDIDADNDEYFLNSSKYKEKWYNLSEWVKSQHNRFGGTGGYTYGALDFYRYIINDPDQYIGIYGEKFYSYPSLNEPTLLKYKYSNEEIKLPTPLSERFLGWYTSSDCTGEAVTSIKAKTTGNITLYAAWDTNVFYELSFISNCDIKYEIITVKNGDKINLPTPTKADAIFLGWYYKENEVTSPMVYNYDESITLTAAWKNTKAGLEDLIYSGEAVTYRNSSVVVQIPTEYVQPEAQFRAAWVSSLVSDFAPSPNKETMKANLTKVLDVLESYNMNAIIYHVRTHNNAFYQTRLAPIQANYGTYESFETWDYLDWFIGECHNRGIEFHAWLNPYRIYSSGAPTAEEIAADYADYPLNPASDANNILVSTSGGAILNPAKEGVRNYIVDVCLELMKNYDIDAIHFDDYFYISLGGSTIINEPDQSDYTAYIAANPSCGYSATSVNDKGQWRRDNVDTFIYDLSTAMRDFNKTNARAVQLGISPTGIYRNGDGEVTYDASGTAITTGSNTRGQEHYAGYLYCDSKKWVDNEWIDYILPQSYWSFGQSVAGYAAVVDWWSKVVKNKDVNLYSGIGLYMSLSGGYTWVSQEYEVSNQILYTTKLPEVKGVCFFSFKSMTTVEASSSNIAYNGLMRIKNEYWVEKVPTPSTSASRALQGK